MIKDRYISFEDYEEISGSTYKEQLKLKTNSSRLNQHYIRQHLGKVIVNTFQWQYWVVVTFGYKPDASECEDCLSKLAYRLDRRLIKQVKDRVCLYPEDRTEWICIPEVQNVGIHYNCFVKFNVSPCIGNGYESEKHWVEVALKNNLETLSSHFPSLGRGKPTVFVRERTRDRTEALKQFFYSAKEFQRGVSHNDIDPSFDRFERTLISREHWKNIPIHRHRTPNKVEHIPPLFDKETEQDLSKFTV